MAVSVTEIKNRKTVCLCHQIMKLWRRIAKFIVTTMKNACTTNTWRFCIVNYPDHHKSPLFRFTPDRSSATWWTAPSAPSLRITAVRSPTVSHGAWIVRRGRRSCSLAAQALSTWPALCPLTIWDGTVKTGTGILWIFMMPLWRLLEGPDAQLDLSKSIQLTQNNYINYFHHIPKII